MPNLASKSDLSTRVALTHVLEEENYYTFGGGLFYPYGRSILPVVEVPLQSGKRTVPAGSTLVPVPSTLLVQDLSATSENIESLHRALFKVCSVLMPGIGTGTCTQGGVGMLVTGCG